MLLTVRLVLALVLGVAGIFFILSAFQDWKWAFKLVLGKDNVVKRGENFSKISFYVIGGLFVLSALLVLF